MGLGPVGSDWMRSVEHGNAVSHCDNKCLQEAIVSLCSSPLRLAAQAFFSVRCANSRKSGLGGGLVEACNFNAVVDFLTMSFTFVFVTDRTETWQWILGDHGGCCLGTIRWDALLGHAQACFTHMRRRLGDLRLAPWLTSTVGVFQKKRQSKRGVHLGKGFRSESGAEPSAKRSRSGDGDQGVSVFDDPDAQAEPVGSDTDSLSGVHSLDEPEPEGVEAGRESPQPCDAIPQPPDDEFGGMRPRRRGRRGSARLFVEGQAHSSSTWRDFTPASIDPKKCYARTWGYGCGGQCKNRPVDGRTLCVSHLSQSHREGLSHGQVTGEIPLKKLQEFVAHRSRVQDRQWKADAEAQRVKAGGKERSAQGSKLWYARYRMWYEADALSKNVARCPDLGPVNGVGDLTEEERKTCLRRVSEYISKNSPLHKRKRCSGGWIEKGKGPTLCGVGGGEEGFEYNGFGGGRVFKWYRKGTFKYFLRQAGWTAAGDDFYNTCTERQVMTALRLTSNHLSLYPMEIQDLQEYAGPQFSAGQG